MSSEQTEALATGTLGCHLRTRSINGLIASETRHPPGFSAARHSHRNASLNIVLNGIYQETWNGGSVAYLPLTLIAKPAGEPHANEFRGRGAHCLLLEVDSDRAATLPSASILHAPHVARGGPAAAIGLRIVRELRSPDRWSDLAVEAAILELLLAAGREQHQLRDSAPAWLARVVAALHDSATTPSLDSLAAEAGLHPAHLARCFKRATGRSIGTYARQLRVTKALQLIRSTSRPLAQVALESGFYDHSHLCRWVKAFTGSTPAELRAGLER